MIIGFHSSMSLLVNGANIYNICKRTIEYMLII